MILEGYRRSFFSRSLPFSVERRVHLVVLPEATYDEREYQGTNAFARLIRYVRTEMIQRAEEALQFVQLFRRRSGPNGRRLK